MDIAAWLQGLGLERYVPAFRDNEIDWEVPPEADIFGGSQGDRRFPSLAPPRSVIGHEEQLPPGEAEGLLWVGLPAAAAGYQASGFDH